ncbi:FAD-dependent oxidoreductase [Dickeya solani]|uniref:FAD-dependent oxidoreductase n=1 Tax=Dickeya solani TaxID=1089444 RepID=A0ABU4ED60_9GAMM|nr:FAD-dependent oxidoreductase [Dickeya solani]MCA7001246.1 FAD-dependent oxidoreductase [Dickeya solani]MCZ0821685.1 FAD-dependent oxidoreductase [Dickeya solani]MDV6996402.1 FAD-dependent oxidoreductase [Dickeya solani]MDV7002177.1 FAD-dependent oxidoreductase [Dickeya solani]MDV7037251.1 FAD-dependent oxidoreductase [Dickeya solani]
MTRIIIIGGVAGGASAAVRARRLSESADIIMLERGPHVSFANCGLPYHIGGDIPDRSALVLKTPTDFADRFNIDVRVRHEVLSIDPVARTLQIADLADNRVYTEHYDKLLLSPGASPIVPPLPGIDLPGVFTLRTITDMDRILAHLQQHDIRQVTVAGGGFIGLEVAEALANRGLSVTLLERDTQVMAPVDPEMAAPLHQVIRQHGIELLLNAGLRAIAPYSNHISGDGHKLTLTLADGQQRTTGMLLMAIGVKPETQLAQAAGLRLGARGGIQVNQRMQTSNEHIYAVGDAVETPDWVNSAPALFPLAGPANRQGRIAADNMLDRERHYTRTQGAAICKVFDHTVGCVGINEKALQRAGVPYQKVYVHVADHASYYPGASIISLKLLFSPDTGTILGAQAVGKTGVDKRIDVIAVAQRAGLTVRDLEDLELTYAPPFNSARDVVNQAGMLANNVLQGDTAICHPEDIINLDPATQCLLDIRSAQELHLHGEYPNALHIPLDTLRQRLQELPADKEILVGCQSGLRGHVAYRLLIQRGFHVRNLSGGFITYRASVAQ